MSTYTLNQCLRVLLFFMEQSHTLHHQAKKFPSWETVLERFSVSDVGWPQMTFYLHQNRHGSSSHEEPAHQVPRYQNFTSSVCLQSVHILTSFDLKWPFIFTKQWVHTVSMILVQASLLKILCLQVFHSLTSSDLKWPLTTIYINRILLLSVGYQHGNY